LSGLSYKTAIKRSSPSVPLKWLLKNKEISEVHLDYGCGRGDDATYLGCDKFDPHYFPDVPTKKYDTITCTYVLNVIRYKKDRNEVLKDIKSLLNEGGVAYITVRRDIKREGKTAIGTFQYLVDLELPLLVNNGKCAIYELKR